MIMVGQSIVLGEVRAEVLVHDEDSRNDQIICQQYILKLNRLPSVIVDTEKMLREAGGSVKLVEVRPHTDGKVFALGAPLEPDGERREEREEHKRIQLLNQKDGFKKI